jgi:uncharacterized protein (TIGR00369 family)
MLEPGLERRIRESIERQRLLTTLGVGVSEIAPGRVCLDLPFRADLCQQNGFVHAGAITTIADSACGYAALTNMPEGSDVLTVEFKVNLLSPARGAWFRATGSVVRAGRTLTVCSADVVTDEGKAVALMQATMITVAPGPS